MTAEYYAKPDEVEALRSRNGKFIKMTDANGNVSLVSEGTRASLEAPLTSSGLFIYKSKGGSAFIDGTFLWVDRGDGVIEKLGLLDDKKNEDVQGLLQIMEVERKAGEGFSRASGYRR